MQLFDSKEFEIPQKGEEKKGKNSPKQKKLICPFEKLGLKNGETILSSKLQRYYSMFSGIKSSNTQHLIDRLFYTGFLKQQRQTIGLNTVVIGYSRTDKDPEQYENILSEYRK